MRKIPEVLEMLCGEVACEFCCLLAGKMAAVHNHFSDRVLFTRRTRRLQVGHPIFPEILRLRLDSRHVSAYRVTVLGKPAKVMRDQKQWMAIFDVPRASGLSNEGFCSAHNIARSAYWKWSKRLGATKSATAPKAIEPTFMPIPIRA